MEGRSAPKLAQPALPARVPSGLEVKARSAINHFLDILEQDPERVVRGAERVVDGLEQISNYIRENPEGAKRAARNTALSAMAKLAKKKIS